ncbi:unnamed protein product [Ixodes pacificus]
MESLVIHFSHIRKKKVPPGEVQPTDIYIAQEAKSYSETLAFPMFPPGFDYSSMFWLGVAPFLSPGVVFDYDLAGWVVHELRRRFKPTIFTLAFTASRRSEKKKKKKKKRTIIFWAFTARAVRQMTVMSGGQPSFFPVRFLVDVVVIEVENVT